MNWEKLLSLRRQGDEKERCRKEQSETRLDFEVDYDRIVFSSAFRSLQDKTQVIPLSKTGFVHTRLTHSMEVAVVGRSLGRTIGKHILQKYSYLKNDLGYQINDFGAIVATAALAHDIGNPPFGHSGEKAIGEFYQFGKGTEIKTKITNKQYKDLCSFEGNANGFKILTETQNGVQGGLRLCYATLGTFTKYPKESLPERPTPNVADKKYGVFQNDVPFFKEIANELQLKDTSEADEMRYARHPLTFLVEAADDICYTIIDLEDGVNHGLISEELAQEYLRNIIQNTIIEEKYSRLATKEDRIAYLRALAIGTLISDATETFMKHETDILSGNFHHTLLSQGKYKKQIDDIINISISNIYNSEEVIQKEISGYNILQNLLELFFTAVVRTQEQKQTSYDRLILQQIPIKYLPSNGTLYDKIMGVTCYVASLTDGKALEIHLKTIGNI